MHQRIAPLLALAALSLTACYDTGDGSGGDAGPVPQMDTSADTTPSGDTTAGPSIALVSISPSEIAASQTGMTDEYFRLDITVSGLSSPVQNLEVTLGGSANRQAPYDDSMYPTRNGNTLTIKEIPFTWLRGLPAGTYPIDIGLTTENADLSQRSAAEVTLTSN